MKQGVSNLELMCEELLEEERVKEQRREQKRQKRKKKKARLQLTEKDNTPKDFHCTVSFSTCHLKSARGLEQVCWTIEIQPQYNINCEKYNITNC